MLPDCVFSRMVCTWYTWYVHVLISHSWYIGIRALTYLYLVVYSHPAHAQQKCFSSCAQVQNTKRLCFFMFSSLEMVTHNRGSLVAIDWLRFCQNIQINPLVMSLAVFNRLDIIYVFMVAPASGSWYSGGGRGGGAGGVFLCGAWQRAKAFWRMTNNIV